VYNNKNKKNIFTNMGQLNIGRITDPTQIVIPPTGVDGFYNENGTLYEIDSTGKTQPLGVKQIAVTISNTELFDLAVTPKVLVPAAGADVVNQVISGYIVFDIVTPFSPTPLPILEIYEGGVEETFFNSGLIAGVSGRWRFIEKHDPTSATASTMALNNNITLSAGSTFSAGTGSATVYLTYTQFNESTL